MIGSVKSFSEMCRSTARPVATLAGVVALSASGCAVLDAPLCGDPGGAGVTQACDSRRPDHCQEAENDALELESAELVYDVYRGDYQLILRGTVPGPCYYLSGTSIMPVVEPHYWMWAIGVCRTADFCPMVVTPIEACISVGSQVGAEGVSVTLPSGASMRVPKPAN